MAIDVWTGNWGQFVIPPDVPRLFRKDGWFDRRRKITRQLKRYFSDMDARQMDDLPILTWAEWSAAQLAADKAKAQPAEQA